MVAKCCPDVAPKAASALLPRLPGRNSLPRTCSLKLRNEIDRLFREGGRLPGDTCTLIWLAGDRFSYGIFLRRTHGRAHQRNRIKRLYREAIRLEKGRLSLPVLIGVLPRTRADKAGFASIHADISALFDRLSQINAGS